VHVELDVIRQLVVQGLADPQRPGELQAEQYELSVEATCALAGVFAAGGYDVAIDDVLEPEAFERWWRPRLDGLEWEVVVVVPSLEETLARSRARLKRVLEAHTTSQHAACSRWPLPIRIDTTGLGVEESLRLAGERLA
jgi:chloramphenicol 3-O-phosphotransferase